MDTLEHMRIRVIYEAGREDSIRMIEFIRDSRIINYIKSIGNSRKEFIKFARYMEALVAYHKFYGGRD
jgi:CRISPR-associated protein Csm2